MRLVTGEKGVHSPSLSDTLYPQAQGGSLPGCALSQVFFLWKSLLSSCLPVSSLSLPIFPLFSGSPTPQLKRTGPELLFAASLTWRENIGLLGIPKSEQFFLHPQAVALPKSWQNVTQQLRCSFECTQYLWTPGMAMRQSLMTIIFPL